jgi:V/A-type H+-transporting ATPase subunit C
MTGYEYGNTRLRAMRARLLTRADFAGMVATGSLDRMLAMLADTAYGPDVEAALVRFKGLHRLDEAIRSNLARALRQMASFYDERPRDRVDLLLDRWDLHNLRALLRLPRAPSTPGDISGLLVPAGRLTDIELSELAALPDIRARLDLMVAWDLPSPATTTALARAGVEYELHGDTTVLESALDQAYAARMDEILGDESTRAAAILRAERDARNLGASLRARAARLDREPGWSEDFDGYVDGGLVPIAVLEEVAATDLAETVAGLLTRTRLLPGWDEAILDWVAHHGLTSLADQLQRATTAAAIRGFVTGDVLGFDIPVAFTFAKEAEARNLRLIGRGIVHGWPATEIEARLEVAA